MIIRFEYKLKDLCWDEICFETEYTIDVEAKKGVTVKLPPCNKTITIDVKDKSIWVEFSDSHKLLATQDKNKFYYEEAYESFEDVRYYELEGFVSLIE